MMNASELNAAEPNATDLPQDEPTRSASREAVPPRFAPVDQAGLREAWDFVRPALDTMDRPDGWLPEDVYLTLRSNGATLYLIYDGAGERAGFFILRLLQDFDGPRVHIWILHARHAEFDVMATFSDDLERLAQRAGAARLTFSTSRPAWHRKAPEYGFTPREITYERVVVQPQGGAS